MRRLTVRFGKADVGNQVSAGWDPGEAAQGNLSVGGARWPREGCCLLCLHGLVPPCVSVFSFHEYTRRIGLGPTLAMSA